MNVKTNTPAVRNARKMNLELCSPTTTRSASPACAPPPANCRSCATNTAWRMRTATRAASPKRRSTTSLPPSCATNAKCVLCRRCVAVCHKVQNVGVIGPDQARLQHPDRLRLGRFPRRHRLHQLRPVHRRCVPHRSAHRARRYRQGLRRARRSTKHVVVQPAPAVRAALGEEFGIPMGTSVTGKMACALRASALTRCLIPTLPRT